MKAGLEMDKGERLGLAPDVKAEPCRLSGHESPHLKTMELDLPASMASPAPGLSARTAHDWLSQS